MRIGSKEISTCYHIIKNDNPPQSARAPLALGATLTLSSPNLYPRGNPVVSISPSKPVTQKEQQKWQLQ